jgi:hypothetical protein
MRRCFAALLLAVAVAFAAAPVLAAPLSVPTVETLAAGHGKVVLRVTAGPSGLPYGFAVYWMTQQDYDDYGAFWPENPAYPGLGWAKFTGSPNLNTFGGTVTTYVLGPGESATVEIGDIADEDASALTTNSPGELDYGQDQASATHSTDYVFCTWAIGGASGTSSSFSLNSGGTTTQSQNCTFTVGYWKNHPAAWPVAGLTLGTVFYSQAQLLQILNQPVGGNGLISLAHQLIAAKLNIANGASSAAVAATIAAADAQIGALVIPPIGAGYLSPASTSSKTQTLDDYNNGIIGPGHCEDTATRGNTTWGSIKSLYR